MRVTTFEPGRAICIESIAGSPRYRGCRHFEAVTNGTRVIETSEVELPAFARPFRGMIERAALRSVAAAYTRLKAALEKR
jgi:hypothetical protein